MRLGYNWQFGPFELADRIGVDWLVERLEADAIEVPPLLRLAVGRGFYDQGEPLGLDGSYRPIVRPPGVMLLADIKRSAAPLRRNRSAALWDVGDGVVCLEFTTKANTIDADVIAMVEEAVALVPQLHKALVIYNEGADFSCGANLAEVDAELACGNWAAIDTLVTRGQRAYQALRDAPFPVVGAPSGMALGGGREVLLHCDAIQAHTETYMGLVECGIGLIPGWGGCLAMLERWTQAGKLPRGPMPVV